MEIAIVNEPISVSILSSDPPVLEVRAVQHTVIITTGYIDLPIRAIENVGGGEGLYKTVTNQVAQFKTLVAGDNITITPAADEVTIAAPPQPIQRVVKTANHILELSDAYKMIDMNVGANNTVTVPANSSVAFDVGTTILISQYGAGQTEVLPGGGVTIRSETNFKKIFAQYCGAVLIKIAADEWYLQGALSA